MIFCLSCCTLDGIGLLLGIKFNKKILYLYHPFKLFNSRKSLSIEVNFERFKCQKFSNLSIDAITLDLKNTIKIKFNISEII